MVKLSLLRRIGSEIYDISVQATPNELDGDASNCLIFIDEKKYFEIVTHWDHCPGWSWAGQVTHGAWWGWSEGVRAALTRL